MAQVVHLHISSTSNEHGTIGTKGQRKLSSIGYRLAVGTVNKGITLLFWSAADIKAGGMLKAPTMGKITGRRLFRDILILMIRIATARGD
jgi:hypothetical protein